MTDPRSTVYPDISDLLSRKEEGRRQRARMTFAEKVEWCEEMRECLEPFRRAREARRAARAKPAGHDKAGT